MMMNINDCINNIVDKTLDQSLSVRNLEDWYRERDYIKLLEIGEYTLRCAVAVYQLSREMLISLYELMPSVPRTVNIHKVCCEMLNISVEALEEFDFPVYKLTLPCLLPNKRKRKADRNNLITDTVSFAVSRFCNENHIAPFEHATVFFVSNYESGSITVDNDNQESAIITNSLNGMFLRDDRPGVCHTVYYSKTVKNAKDIKTEVYIVDSDHDIKVLSLIKSS